jgi:cation-transporting ATPase 13A1
MASKGVGGTVKSIRVLSLRDANFRLDTLPFGVYYLAALIFHVCVSYNHGDLYIVPTLGLLIAGNIAHLLVFLSRMWSIDCDAWFGYKTCGSKESIFSSGTHVLVKPLPNQGASQICNVRMETIAGDDFKYFMYQRQKYVLTGVVPGGDAAEPAAYPIEDMLFQEKIEENGLSLHRVNERNAMFGKNSLAIPPPSYIKLFKEQMVAPFFLFQVFCCALWCLDEYWYYSVFTFFMILLFEFTMCFQRMKNMEHIYQMARPSFPCTVFRENKWTKIQSTFLLPGDLVDLKKTFSSNSRLRNSGRNGEEGGADLVFPCDAVLLSGSVLVNEAMLTGESEYKWKSGFYSAGTTDSAKGSGGAAEEILLQMRSAPGADKTRAIYGGTSIVRTTSGETLPGNAGVARRGCIAYVTKTGFNTKQGKMMRTIFYFAENIDVGDRDSYMFLLILVCFAVMASVYVWNETIKDPYANRWKLVLHCIMIVTSVVPPELPMELSLTVTTSLAALRKLYIFCSEPFRIPIAGKVKICCFDKTGTLTSDEYSVTGLACPSVAPEGPEDIGSGVVKASEAPVNTSLVLAGCHGLACVADKIVGDSMEKAILEAVGWTLRENGAIVPNKSREWKEEDEAGTKIVKIRIVRRFNFSSKLKRMCCVIAVDHPNTKPKYMVVSKGAPEILHQLCASCPSNYEETFVGHTRRGGRVLALAYRELESQESLRESDLMRLPRASLESDLTFGGFVVLSSPLKPGTKKTIRVLLQSLHRLIMITGDNEYTACEVAMKSGMSARMPEQSLILQKITGSVNGGSGSGSDSYRLAWTRVNGGDSKPVPFVRKELEKMGRENMLCVAGSALEKLAEEDVAEIVKYATVFARVSPRHKERLIIHLKRIDTVLMCGDGSNDVGALRRADVGISVVNNPMFERKSRTAAKKALHAKRDAKRKYTSGRSSKSRSAPARNAFESDNVILELGDASLASPFTSKLPSIKCAIDIIRQGRCTLVTTVQMYKVLGVNCLVTAYSLSTLHLYGVKQGDSQATAFAIIVSVLFLLNARSKPTNKLSASVPPQSIFEFREICSIFGQVTINFFCMLYLIGECDKHILPHDPSMERDGDFRPNLINSALYLMSCTTTINSFMFNYTGLPYMESFFQNKAFSRFCIVALGLTFLASFGWFPPLNDYLELVEIENDDLAMKMSGTYLANTVLMFVWQKICMFKK